MSASSNPRKRQSARIPEMEKRRKLAAEAAELERLAQQTLKIAEKKKRDENKAKKKAIEADSHAQRELLIKGNKMGAVCTKCKQGAIKSENERASNIKSKLFNKDLKIYAQQDKKNDTSIVCYKKLDKNGRPTGIEAWLKPGDLTDGSPADTAIHPPGWTGNGAIHKQERGHLLGNQLGGTGTDPRNLVTIAKNPTNVSEKGKENGMSTFENKLKSHLNTEITKEDGTKIYKYDKIYYKVTPNYESDDDLMPRTISMYAKTIINGPPKKEKVIFDKKIINTGGNFSH